MPNCAVLSCKNYTNKPTQDKNKVSFHRFPGDPKVKEKWIEATGQKNWFPTKHSRICSVHFNEDSFKDTKTFRRLSTNAIPTIDVLKTLTKAETPDPLPEHTVTDSDTGTVAPVENNEAPVADTSTSVCGQSYFEYFNIRGDQPTSSRDNADDDDDDEKNLIVIKTENEYEDEEMSDEQPDCQATSSMAKIISKIEPLEDCEQQDSEPDAPKTLLLKKLLEEKSLIIERQSEEIIRLHEQLSRLRTGNVCSKCLKEMSAS